MNSTPLGQVISDRQLYRHRERGNHLFATDGRIDVLRYAAWLVTERHTPRRRVPRQSKPCSYERVRWRVTVPDVLALLKRQEYRCALTGRELEPSTAALDHIVPVSRGGDHVIENAQVLHKEANRAKGTLTNEQFVQLCREVVAHADSKLSQILEMRQSA